jgi:hypothetical protein
VEMVKGRLFGTFVQHGLEHGRSVVVLVVESCEVIAMMLVGVLRIGGALSVGGSVQRGQPTPGLAQVHLLVQGLLPAAAAPVHSQSQRHDSQAKNWGVSLRQFTLLYIY